MNGFRKTRTENGDPKMGTGQQKRANKKETGDQEPTAPLISRAKSGSASSGKRLSACRNTSTSPTARFAPARNCTPRPDGQRIDNLDGPVVASTVAHNHFLGTALQSGTNACLDVGGFVPSRHNDADLHRWPANRSMATTSGRPDGSKRLDMTQS